MRAWPAYSFFPPQASDALGLDGGEELVLRRQRRRRDLVEEERAPRRGDRLTSRAVRRALIRGRTVSSKSCRTLAVTMKSSAHHTSFMVWTCRCPLPLCTTASSPSNTRWLTTGEPMHPRGTPTVVAHRMPWSIKPLRSHLDNTPSGLGIGVSSHANWCLTRSVSRACRGRPGR
jgi:hypothetical protein